MRKGSRIGERIQQEQQLSAEAIEWIVCIAAAIVQAFGAEPAIVVTTIRICLQVKNLYVEVFEYG